MPVLELCVIASAALNLAVCSDRPAAAQGHDELQAIEHVDAMDAAAAKINDVDTLASLWTEDGVLMQPMSEPVIGRANIRALLETQRQQAISSGIEVLSYTELWRDRQIHDGTAFEWGTIAMTIRLPNRKEITRTVYAGRYLTRAADGGWRFARVVISPTP